MAEQVFLAVDLGASSGRVVAGRFNGGRLSLEEVHRFDNVPVMAGGTLSWDVLRLWSDLQAGLRRAADRFPRQIVSLGVDTWGVDFALLSKNGELLSNPVHYRDRRTEGMLDKAVAAVGLEEIFAQTGLQFMPINTLYQVLAMCAKESPLLAAAKSFLMIPDLFNWLLTGQVSNEFTNATTTQFFNPRTHDWARDLLGRLDIPTAMLGPIVEPGANLGGLRPEVATETNLGGAAVIAPGTHDTASAVMAVPAASGPAERPNWAYLSSGTWSLMGAEVPRPVIDDRCLALNFTNEGGVGGSIRLLKNITGLWLLQECRRVWAKRGEPDDWDELNRLAAATPPLTSFVDPDDPSFLAPSDMPQAIRDWCRRTGQSEPVEKGSVIRCAIESLALKYRTVLGRLESLIGGRVEVIHVVGGGAKNRPLCQATADACGRTVLAGPVEATATGNILVQAIAAGAVGDIAQARNLVRESFAVDEYRPNDTARWDAAWAAMQDRAV